MMGEEESGASKSDAFLAWVTEFCQATWGEAPERWERLVADGSNRQFFRVRTGGRSLVALSHPEGTSEGTGENEAYWSIGIHLHGRGVPVPALHAHQREQGWIILEDLGNLSLKDAVRSASSSDQILTLYEPVLDGLITLQIQGPKGFDDRWCYQGPRYDEGLMLARESGYFLNAFLKGHFGWAGDEESLLQEFRGLARLASRAPTRFLIHRDFQSRNILLPSPGRPHIIDFQGARWGPLQYDVAALTIDPYVDFGPVTRDGVLRAYLERLENSNVMSAGEFMEHYPIIALHRNLQILGAFAFLARVKQKPFFLQWIPRALSHLRDLLVSHPEWPCTYLRDEVENALLIGRQ